jgi:hypothetical protein
MPVWKPASLEVDQPAGNIMIPAHPLEELFIEIGLNVSCVFEVFP